jgi:predicted Rossmann-fold nucleotide-binding protein
MNARPFRVLVCGGRNNLDRAAVFRRLDALVVERGPLFVIEGGAKGVDRSAKDWRVSRLYPGETFVAAWERDGKGAGPIRNRKMLVDGQPDLVLAFPGGKGTANMIAQARTFRVPVEIVE